jgi:hypothetical protein
LNDLLQAVRAAELVLMRGVLGGGAATGVTAKGVAAGPEQQAQQAQQARQARQARRSGNGRAEETEADSGGVPDTDVCGRVIEEIRRMNRGMQVYRREVRERGRAGM